mgnify:FL=1
MGSQEERIRVVRVVAFREDPIDPVQLPIQSDQVASGSALLCVRYIALLPEGAPANAYVPW